MEQNGYQIRHSPCGLEWLALVALPRQHPTVIVASDRDTALAKANGWVDLQRASDKKPE